MSDRVNESGGDGNGDPAPKKLSWWQFLPWVLSACCLFGLVWVRYVAELGDFGLVNVLTYILLLNAMIFAMVAMILTTPRRVWLTAVLLPIVAGAVLLWFFKLDRVDSEIVPMFVWRWNKPVVLPESSDSTAQATLASTLAADPFFAPRDTDYPKFLGPNANSTLPDVALETNWAENPPQIAWKQPIGKGWSGFAVQGNAAYTMEQRENEEWVSCYSADSGQLLWHYAIPGLHFNVMGGTGPRATPTIFEGRVYAQSAVSELVCLDMRTGERIWSFDLLKAANTTQAEFEASVAWGRSASPVIVDGKVIAALGGAPGSAATSKLQSLIALDAKTGAEVWRAGKDQISYSTPVIATLLGQQQILYISESKVTAHAIADGAELWSVSWPSHSNSDASVSQPIVIDDSHVFLSKGYGTGAELLKISKNDVWSVEEVWKAEGILRTKFTSCVINDGHAYGLNDGIMECVNLETGKRSWKKGRYRHGQVLLAGETMVVTAEIGSVILVDTDSKELRELASLQVIGDVTWNTAALSGKRLLIRNSDEAACVLLPLKSSTDTSPSKSRHTTATKEFVP